MLIAVFCLECTLFWNIFLKGVVVVLTIVYLQVVGTSSIKTWGGCEVLKTTRGF